MAALGGISRGGSSGLALGVAPGVSSEGILEGCSGEGSRGYSGAELRVLRRGFFGSSIRYRMAY